MSEMRLQKYIAHCGYASRRKAEQIILDGRVSVNGNIVFELGTKVATTDIVEIDNVQLQLEKKQIYILLNKPAGIVTTSDDEFNRKTVLDLLEDIKERVYPVGRLDYGTSGLLILTNDGDFTNFLTHPSHEIEKTYQAMFYGEFNNDKKILLEEGIDIGDYITRPAKVNIIKEGTIEISIKEGKNRQIRRMFDEIECEVYNLSRVSIGALQDKTLKVGKWRLLDKEEIRSLGYDIK